MGITHITRQLRKRAKWAKDAKAADEKRGDEVEATWHDGRMEALLQVVKEIESGEF